MSIIKSKKIFCGLLVIALMAFTTTDTVKPQVITSSGEHSEMSKITFEAGEEIVYKLYYNWNFIWLSAGEVTFCVEDDGDRFHLSAKGRTYKSYEWFFKVDDTYDTYIDKTSLLPETAIRDVREGGYTLYDKVTFDQDNHKAVSLRGKSKDKTIRREYDIEAQMHDILSVIYYTRSIDYENYEEGEEFPVKIFMDKEVWPLNVTYRGKEPNKKVKGQGVFKTIRFSPEVISGDVFEENTEMNIWVSDDENRIPLLIESPVSVGAVKAVIKDYKGLKYDFEAKVN